MKKMRYILVLACIVAAVACGKDKPASKPSIKIKSISPTTVGLGGICRITLEFTDKEGDIGTDSLFIKKLRLNTIEAVSGNRLIDSFYFKLPAFPDKTRGELLLDLDYEFHLKDASQAPTFPDGSFVSDSIAFRFALQDLAGHTSDTVETPLIVVQRVN